MKVLLTGATGFVGSYLGPELVRKGHELVCLTRDKKRAEKELEFPCQLCELSELSSLKGIEAVVHLAGASVAAQRWTSKYKKVLRSSRVDFTQKILKELDPSYLKVFVQASATGYYNQKWKGKITEDGEKAKGFLGDLVRDWEKASEEIYCRRVYFRMGMLVGKGSAALEKMAPIFKKNLGASLAAGKHYMPWVHVDDVVRAFCTALEKESYVGVYNLCAPELVQNKKFTQVLAETLKVPLLVPAAPKLALFAAYGRMSQILLNSLPVYPEKLLKQGFDFKFEKLEPALQDSFLLLKKGERKIYRKQWVPSPLEETFEFFKDENNLEALTPSDLSFKVLKKSTEKIEEGTLIDYRLKLGFIPFKWRTLIKNWNEPYAFSDEQLKGPYAKWDHTHEFSKLGSGTLMKDLVIYKAPLGALGRLVAGRFVDRKVKKIFDYRYKKVKELF